VGCKIKTGGGFTDYKGGRGGSGFFPSFKKATFNLPRVWQIPEKKFKGNIQRKGKREGGTREEKQSHANESGQRGGRELQLWKNNLRGRRRFSEKLQ